jgi:hypothetical protein
MKSAAISLMEIFGIDAPSVRPAKIEPLLMGLLYTVSSNNLLDDAIRNISELTELDIVTQGDIPLMKVTTGSKELVGLYNDDKSLRLLLLLLPYILSSESYTVVNIADEDIHTILNRTGKTNRFRELKRILTKINGLELGYKVVQRPRAATIGEFHILRYSSTAELLALLQEYDLQMPSVLDKVISC